MRVIGIDPGSHSTGYGVVESSRDGLRYVDSGCVRAGTETLAVRLKTIYDGIAGVIAHHRPDVMVIEQVFMARNPRAALVLGHARGSAMLAAVNRRLPVREYAALEIKQAVVGTGRAGKEQVQHMVRALLGLDATPSSDAADALACAICHIHTDAVRQRMNAVSPGAAQ